MTSNRENADKILIFCCSDDPERAYPPFFMASAAVAMDMEVTMFFCMSGLNLIRKGGAEKIVLPGVPKPLQEYIKIVQDGGGKLCICAPGLPVVGMREEDAIDGAEMAGAASFISEGQEADFVMTF